MKYPAKYRVDRAERYAVIILFFASIICFIIPELLQRATAKTTIIYKQSESAKIVPPTNPLEEKSKPPAEINFSNPNTISKDSLVYYGLDAATSQRLINFRNKGKVYYTKEDLLDVFGLSQQKIESLTVKFTFNERRAKPVKRARPVIIVDINNASDTELQELPGIGPVYSSRIIKYRSLLGGYCHKDQLKEVYGFDKERFDAIEDRIKINHSAIKRIDINQCEFITLLRHPYISKNVCKAIINYRGSHGNFTSVSQLLNIKIIDADLLEKIKPYLKTTRPAKTKNSTFNNNPTSEVF